MNVSAVSGGPDPLLYLIIDVITRLPWTRIVLVQDALGKLREGWGGVEGSMLHVNFKKCQCCMSMSRIFPYVT